MGHGRYVTFRVCTRVHTMCDKRFGIHMKKCVCIAVLGKCVVTFQMTNPTEVTRCSSKSRSVLCPWASPTLAVNFILYYSEARVTNCYFTQRESAHSPTIFTHTVHAILPTRCGNEWPMHWHTQNIPHTLQYACRFIIENCSFTLIWLVCRWNNSNLRISVIQLFPVFD